MTPTQDPPVANNDTVTVTEDTATNVTAGLLGNDTDPDNDTLTVTGVSNATGGSVVLQGGVVTFTPDADLCGAGTGSFDYDISDGHGGSDTGHATVNITCVNDAPHAVNDSVSGTEDTDLVIAGADPASRTTPTPRATPCRSPASRTPPAAPPSWARATSPSRPTPTCAATTSPASTTRSATATAARTPAT